MKYVAGLLLAVLIAFQPAVANEAEISNIRQMLRAAMPDAVPDSIAPAAIPGLYEIIFGAQIIYVSRDGRYIMEGNLYDMQQRVNITENRRSAGRAKVIREMKPESLVVFAPEQGKTRFTITAFTDIDCGYCRKLHNEMKDFHAQGIAIRYAAYPRSGLNTPSYFKAESVWCAADRKAAMTKAKNGENLETKTCSNPIAEHMKAATLVGVSGTPTLVLENGTVIPGYVEASRLVKILEEEGKKL